MIAAETLELLLTSLSVALVVAIAGIGVAVLPWTREQVRESHHAWSSVPEAGALLVSHWKRERVALRAEWSEPLRGLAPCAMLSSAARRGDTSQMTEMRNTVFRTNIPTYP